MHRLHAVDRRDAGALAPGQKFPRCLRIGAARVLIANVGGEEFEKADMGARASGGGKGGSAIDYEGRELVHGFAPNGIILICFLLTQ